MVETAKGLIRFFPLINPCNSVKPSNNKFTSYLVILQYIILNYHPFKTCHGIRMICCSRRESADTAHISVTLNNQINGNRKLHETETTLTATEVHGLILL